MKTIYFILLCMMLLGCKTKQAEHHQSCETAQQFEALSVGRMSDTQLKSGSEMTQNSRKDCSIDELIQFTIWSQPDSAGRQYPTVTGNIDRNTKARETTDTNQSDSLNFHKTDDQNLDFLEAVESDFKSEDTLVKEYVNMQRTQAITELIVLIAAALFCGYFVLKGKKAKK